MRNREDAEDAAQDCFLNAFVHLKNFDGRSQFATWLTRIAINAALMKLRKNRGAREVPIDEPNPSAEPVAQRKFRYDAPDPEESCSLRERNRIVTSAISEEFRKLSRFLPVIVLVPKSAVHDKSTQKKLGSNKSVTGLIDISSALDAAKAWFRNPNATDGFEFGGVKGCFSTMEIHRNGR